MYFIEWVPKKELSAIDRADANWTRMSRPFSTETEATAEMRWYDIDDPDIEYRVVEVGQ